MSWASATKRSLPGPTPAEFMRPDITPSQVDWPRLVTLDFETYWDANYTLSKMSTSEYVRDPRFKAQQVGIKIGDKPTKVYGPKTMQTALARINWATHSLLCHNTAFDGFILHHHFGIKPAYYYDTLSMARGLHSNEIGASLNEVAEHYGAGSKIEGALELTKGVLNWSKELFEATAIYCAQDVSLTHVLFRNMHAKYPASEIELIDLTMRMFCDPVLRVDIPRVEKELARELAERERKFYATVNPRDWDDQIKLLLKTKAERELQGTERDMLMIKRVIGSNDRFADLLRAEGVEPPLKISPAWMKKDKEGREDETDKYTYAFAKDDLDFINIPADIDQWRGDLDTEAVADVPLIAAKQARLEDLVSCRIAVKSTTNITRAERFLTAGANGMPLPVGYAYYRAHCVPGNTEVLTREGWVRLDVWEGGEIAQVHPDQRVEFLPGTKFAGPVETDWVRMCAPYLKCDFTLGHTMPYFTQKSRKWATDNAGNLADRNAFNIPVSGHLISTGAITPDQMRVLVMVQADGSFETDASIGRRMCVFVKKPRKIERARQLLVAASVPFREQTYPSHPDMVRFIVRHSEYPAWLTPERKLFGPWLLDSTAEARTALLSEVEHWDGYRDHANCIHYSSSERINADWVVTLAHLDNKCASIYTAPAQGKRRKNHTVAFRERSFIKIGKSDKFLVNAPKPTFCASTQTGFWLARVGTRIFITGNTGRFGGNNKMNMQNLTRGGELRLSILAPKGHQLAVADSGQIEARVTAWLWGQDDLLQAFRESDAGIGPDAYCNFAALVHDRPITKADKTERFLGKVCVLGLGFSMGPDKFQMTLAKGALGGPPIHFSRMECQRIVNIYRQANSKIVQGWGKCKQIIEDMAAGRTGSYKCLNWEEDTIWLPNGMSLKYPGLKSAMGDKGWEEFTYQAKEMRKRIYGGLLAENLAQSLARIIVMDQMLAINKKYRCVMTTHDEVIAMPKTAQAKTCFSFMLKCMTAAPAWCSDIPLAAEGGIAHNYAK